MSQLENSSEVTTLFADKEHNGIQFVVPVIMLLTGILIYIIVDSLLLQPLLGGTEWDSFSSFLRLILSIGLGVGIGGIAENLLKNRWPSGRMLHLDSSGITIQDKEKPVERIEWAERLNVLRWSYILRGYPRGGRERRVPTGHYLLAGKLLQDESSLFVHSYMKPRQAESVPGFTRFSNIDMASIFKGGLFSQFSRPLRPTIPTNFLAGPQGKVWVAEKERWVSSFELEPDDFITLMAEIERVVSRPARSKS
ncbi:MAG: hypothetical protein JXA42_13210 [Anaerolineales bacterium]|nr:hypothetical protein [Anaerolineales bacterium]